MELGAPERYSADDIASAFAATLDIPVRSEMVPHASWAGLFRSQGRKYPEPRIRMIDGFNEGWIDFEGTRTRCTKVRPSCRQ
jgi:NAD(P)H dehydrogenase (quinone)